jgi:hypothetical protein
MSRVRLALAGASVLAGVAGAFLVVRLADTESAAPPALTTAGGARVVVVASQSRCLLDRGARLAKFHVVLHNPGRQDREAEMRAAIGTRGAGLTTERPTQTVALLATERRAYEFNLAYDPSRGTPDQCSVSLDDDAPVPIRIEPGG